VPVDFVANAGIVAVASLLSRRITPLYVNVVTVRYFLIIIRYYCWFFMLFVDDDCCCYSTANSHRSSL
jgi:hypothetical protein